MTHGRGERTMVIGVIAGLVLVALVAAACSQTPPAASGGGGSNEVTTPSGLKYTDVVVGSGAQPQAGQTAVVHYTGWLLDGKKFDSSKDRGQPFSFPRSEERRVGKECRSGWSPYH